MGVGTMCMRSCMKPEAIANANTMSGFDMVFAFAISLGLMQDSQNESVDF